MYIYIYIHIYIYIYVYMNSMWGRGPRGEQCLCMWGRLSEGRPRGHALHHTPSTPVYSPNRNLYRKIILKCVNIIRKMCAYS